MFFILNDVVLRCCAIATVLVACLSTFVVTSQQVNGAPFLRDGSVRLRGGAHTAQGNVEIFHLSEWRPVCDDNWDMRSARVVCRQLGFLRAIEATTASEFGLTNVGGGGGNKFWLDDVRCWGYERNLSSCMSAGWGHYDCQPNEAAGVICANSPDDEQLNVQRDAPASGAAALQEEQQSRPHQQQNYVNLLHSPQSFARAVAAPPLWLPRSRSTTSATSTVGGRSAVSSAAVSVAVDPTIATNLTRTTRQFPMTPAFEEIDTALSQQQHHQDPEDGPGVDSRRIPESLQRLLDSLMSSGQIPTVSSNGARLAPRFVSSSREQRPESGSIVNRYEIQLAPQEQPSEVTQVRRQYVVSRPTARVSTTRAAAAPQLRPTVSSPTLLPDPFAGVADDEPYATSGNSDSRVIGRPSSSMLLQRAPEPVPDNFFRNNVVEHSAGGDVIVRSRTSTSAQTFPTVSTPARTSYSHYSPASSEVSYADDSTIPTAAAALQARQYAIDEATSGMRKLRLLADNGRYSATGGIVQYWDASRQFWRVVCGNGWTLREAEVVCRHMNSGHARAARQRPVQEIILAMESDKPFALSESIKCSGTEAHLHECRRASPDISGCPSQQQHGSFQGLIAAAVECSSGVDLPDLAPEAQRLQSSMYLQRVPLYMLQCAMEEQCLSRSAYEQQQAPGMSYMWPYQTRNLLRFTLATKNIGTTDFRPHIQKNMWEWHACHQHYHSMEVFAHYDVMDQTGRKVAEGHKASFCLEDNECEHDWQRKYACANYGDQGISAGCVDTYKADIDCQWVDMTDVQPGIYTMRVAINPDRKVAESSFDNNVVECQLYYYEQTVMAQNCQTKPLL